MKNPTVEKKFRADFPNIYLNSNFREWFGSMKFNSKAKMRETVSQKLPRPMTSPEILNELKPNELSIEEIYNTLKTLEHSVWFLAFRKDKDDVPRLVYAYWDADDGGWDVYADGASDSNEWHAGFRLFSSNSRSPETLSSSALCPFLPSK